MTDQKQIPAAKKRRSALYRQRRAALIGLAVVILLAAAFAVIWAITSRRSFEDVDGKKYQIRQKGEEYVLVDADKNPVSQNENGNYVTPAGTILTLDRSTGEYTLVAIVETEGTEALQYNAYSGQYDILLYPSISVSDIRSIRIVNEKDDFGFERNDNALASEQPFVLYGYTGGERFAYGNTSILNKSNQIEYDTVMFATLANLTGYTVMLDRLDLSNPDKAYGFAANGFAEYGLPERAEDATKYFVITAKDGTQHKVILGDIIPSGAGYYARYADRDTVYIMKEFTASENNSTLAQTLFGTREDFAVPHAIVPMDNYSYFDVSDFKLHRAGEAKPIISFTYVPIETRKGTFEENFPYAAQGVLEGYKIHSYHADDCLQNLQLMAPLRTVRLDRAEEALDATVFERDFGLAYMIEFTYNRTRGGEDQAVDEKDAYHQYILISPLSANDTYFVYSSYFNMVVEAARSDFEFLEWTPFEWISDNIFVANIGYCTDLSIATKPSTEIVSGVNRVDFKLDNSASDQTQSNGSISTSGLRVRADFVTTGESRPTEEINTDLFRRFYQTLLYTSLEGNAALTDEQMEQYRASGDAGADMIIRIAYDKDGKGDGDAVEEYVFRFYHYSGRQSFVTVNGNGSFYMLRNRTDKILNDVARVLSGDPSVEINPQGKY